MDTTSVDPKSNKKSEFTILIALVFGMMLVQTFFAPRGSSRST